MRRNAGGRAGRRVVVVAAAAAIHRHRRDGGRGPAIRGKAMHGPTQGKAMPVTRDGATSGSRKRTKMNQKVGWQRVKMGPKTGPFPDNFWAHFHSTVGSIADPFWDSLCLGETTKALGKLSISGSVASIKGIISGSIPGNKMGSSKEWFHILNKNYNAQCYS